MSRTWLYSPVGRTHHVWHDPEEFYPKDFLLYASLFFFSPRKYCLFRADRRVENNSSRLEIRAEQPTKCRIAEICRQLGALWLWVCCCFHAFWFIVSNRLRGERPPHVCSYANGVRSLCWNTARELSRYMLTRICSCSNGCNLTRRKSAWSDYFEAAHICVCISSEPRCTRWVMGPWNLVLAISSWPNVYICPFASCGK